MRPIKFRAWDKVNKRFEIIERFDFDIVGNVKYVWVRPYMKKLKRLEVGVDCDLTEFTGLTDKNGVEIYEGDIVRTITEYYSNKKEHIIEIKWNDDIENDSFGQPLTIGYCIRGGELEVIGNIYENSELLSSLT